LGASAIAGAPSLERDMAAVVGEVPPRQGVRETGAAAMDLASNKGPFTLDYGLLWFPLRQRR